MFGDIIDFLNYIFSESPVWSKIILTIIFIIVIIFTIYKNNIINYFKDKIFKKKKSKSIDIKNHGIFLYIDEILKIKIKQINFNNKNKNKLYKDFISIPIKLLKKHLYRISERENIDNMSNDEFNVYIMNIIFDYIDDVTINMKAEFGEDILNIIDQNGWYNNVNNFTLDYIKHVIANRDDNDSNTFILASILAIMNFSLKTIFETTTEKYKSLNGILDDISNRKYKNTL